MINYPIPRYSHRVVGFILNASASALLDSLKVDFVFEMLLPPQQNLFMNMLSDRSFQVSINGKESRKKVLNKGLPQGSVLSCFLYCIYTSDLPQIGQLKSRLLIYLFGADLQLFIFLFKNVAYGLKNKTK